MNAAELLSAGGLNTAQVCAEFHPVEPSSVLVVPAPRLVVRLWPKGIGAMALPGRILVGPSVIGRHPARVAGLMVHELVHVRQWHDYGKLGFLRRYLSEYLRGRTKGMRHQDAYLANRLEVEAQQVAARHAIPIE